MRGVLSSSGWVLVGTAVSRGATLLASVLVARLIVPAQFGRLTLVLTSVTLLAGLAGLGLALAITRQVAGVRALRPNLAGRYMGSVIALTAAAGVTIAVAVALARTDIAHALLGDSRFGSLVAAGGVAVLFAALNGTIQGALTGLESFRALAVAQWMQGLATASGLIVGAAAAGADGAIVGFALGQLAAAARSLVLLHRNAATQGIRLSYATRREDIGELFRYGAPAFVASVTLATATLAAQFLLSRQPAGYASVALFSVAYRWQLAIMFVPACVAPVLVPVMTRLHVSEQSGQLAAIFRSTMWGTFALAAAAAALVALAAPLLLGLSGSFYAKHPLPLVILAAASVPAALNNVLSSTSISLGAMRDWLVSDLALAAVLLGTAAVLVARSDATGLATAYLAGMVATDLVLAWPLARRLAPAVSSA